MALINLPKTGPDSWQGIRVALKCMCIMALTAGNIRSSGVMYVGIMNHFGVTREEASWPVSLCGAMLSLIGTVSGPLAQAFSPKPVILCGSLLIFIGLVASVFAPNVAWLTFTFGIVFGSGLGTVYTINVIFLQQYFVKMRGLALGLNYAGSTTAGFIFPIVITYLLGEYGFQGTVLILSGVLLHIFVLCLTHREAPWLRQRTHNGEGGKESRTSSSEAVPTSGRAIVGTSHEEVQESGGTFTVGHVTAEERAEATAEASDETESPNEVRMYPFEELKTPAEEKQPNQHSNARTEVPDIPKYVTSVSVELPSASAETLETDTKRGEKPSAPRISVIASLSILKIPEFLVIIFSFALFLYAYDAYFTTIIDFTVDQNIPLLKATTIVPLYSATDMIARLSIPQLSDRGYINKMLLQCLAYALQSACFFMVPIAASTGQFFWIATLSMVQSIGTGTSIVMYGVLMAELIGVSRLPMGYGIVGLFVGLTYFTKPYFVGHFRDTIGDYTQMYIVCGFLTAAASLSWLVTWYVHRVTKRGRSFSNVSNKATEDGVEKDAANGAAAANISEDTTSIGRRSRADSTVLHL